MNRVLVTGAAGRIGNRLCGTLVRAGWHVRAIVLPGTAPERYSNLLQVGVEVVRLDCLAPAFEMSGALDGIEIAVHLACSSTPAISEAKPFEDMDVNVKGTLRIFEQAQRVGVSRFIFASSGGTIYGNSPVHPIAENFAAKPAGMHGAMKLACEAYLNAQAGRGNTALQILRIANPYGMAVGERQQGFVDIAIRRLRNGEQVTVWGDGNVRRDFIHVDDLIAAFLAVLDHPSPCLFNIGSGVDHSLREVLDLMGRHYDLRERILWQTGRSMDVARNALDIRKARELLGWAPRISLADGIARTIDES